MSLPKVKVISQNFGLGQSVQTDDGVVGFLLQGVAAASLAVLTPKLITTLQAAVDLGIDEDYDTDNSVEVYSAIKEFYDEAKSGAKYYFMIVPQAVDVETMLDKTEANYAVKLLNFAQGKIRLLGIVRNPAGGYEPNTAANNIDLDIINALTTGQALAQEYYDKFMPFRIALPAHAYAGDAGALVDLKTFDKNKCGIVIGGTASGRNAVSLFLGRLASVPVQRNAGRVKSGSLAITEVYIGTETYIEAQDDVEVIHDKGFVTLRQHIGKAGYYFTDNPTATAATDDFDSFTNGRVDDKAAYITNQIFVNEILDEVAINATTGQIETAKAKYYQAIILDAINTAMTANNEISGVNVLVDPAQNVLATEKICVEIRVVPVGYAKEFLIKLGFNNPSS